MGASGVLTDLFQMPAAINYAKLRVSYAQVGNDVSAFSTNPLYTFNQGGIANPPGSYPILDVSGLELKPEKANLLRSEHNGVSSKTGFRLTSPGISRIPTTSTLVVSIFS
ncbi:hypothetical protein [Paraflavitalea speifideaquila]|uniref:hypothetical protein n=1 Tax=Paraflavitalea speifideaquila TaxID=3076558 RepID=UPI0028EB6D78|nr:hypothetical protein [Paraflavitalea speifideiaquila]